MVYEVKFYVRIVFKALNMSWVNLTRGTPEGSEVPKVKTVQGLKICFDTYSKQFSILLLLSVGS